ncbi:uncharacterized protein EHS24_008168 [Apiotrichum porosum]|uniref:RRM domain-containing protein n=1 Tax=Apiotrichum porosum TaxID=105984 RepID=A0A427XT40_9TREE|nr:uncharacterized protein EHS24_008168 [Apiotrichum porosum]RSH81968.1 hypothetical protein EHS24_008168 [Apiotrichum porosum]
MPQPIALADRMSVPRPHKVKVKGRGRAPAAKSPNMAGNLNAPAVRPKWSTRGWKPYVAVRPKDRVASVASPSTKRLPFARAWDEYYRATRSERSNDYDRDRYSDDHRGYEESHKRTPGGQHDPSGQRGSPSRPNDNISRSPPSPSYPRRTSPPSPSCRHQGVHSPDRSSEYPRKHPRSYENEYTPWSLPASWAARRPLESRLTDQYSPPRNLVTRDERTVIVGPLPRDVRPEDVVRLMVCGVGPVRSVKMEGDMAIIVFEEGDAERAKERFHNKVVDQRYRLSVVSLPDYERAQRTPTKRRYSPSPPRSPPTPRPRAVWSPYTPRRNRSDAMLVDD